MTHAPGWNTWFDPLPASRLALLRMLVGSFAFAWLATQYTELIAVAGGSETVFRPVGVIRLLDDPVSVGKFRFGLLSALMLGIPFIAGFAFRVTGPLFAAAFLCVMSYQSSWLEIDHGTCLLVVHVAILGLTPAANALSLDALDRSTTRRWWDGAWPRTDGPVDWRYGWPVRLVAATTLLSFFLAGVAKIAGPAGWSWATGDALASILRHEWIVHEVLGDGAPVGAAVVLRHASWLPTGLAVLLLAIELSAPLMLLLPRAARFWAVTAVGLQWALAAVVGAAPLYTLTGLAVASLFPLERVLGRSTSTQEVQV